MSNLVPEGWSMDNLSSVATLEYGKSPNVVRSESGIYPIIGTGGLVGYATDFLLGKPSVVIGRKGTLNKPIYIDVPFWATDTTYFCRFDKTTEPKWFYYKICDEGLEKYNEASGVPSLNRETLYSIQIHIPPLLEQKKIASILGSVDEVIENTQKQIEKLQDLKKATMNELLTKGIDHTEFKDSELGRIPEGWRNVRVEEFFSINTKTVVPKDFPTEKFTYFSLPAFDEFGTSVDVLGKEIESNKFNITEKTILVSKLNPRKPRVILAQPKKLRACASTEFMLFVPKDISKVSLNYFSYYFISRFFQKRLELVATGSTNSHVRVSPTETNQWKIAVPPIPEQKKIASILTSVDEVIQKNRQKLHQTQSLKKSLMQDLLTGKVRVEVSA